MVNGVLLRPLPYPEPERLVGVWHVAPGIDLPGGGDLNAAPSMFFTYGDEGRVFESLGLWSGGAASVTGVSNPERVETLVVTHGVLDALGVPPILGRWFSRDDDQPGAPETVILTYGYWQRRFGGDTAVVGRPLTINAVSRVVIGVMPQQFRFLATSPDLILPQRFDRDTLFLGNFSYQGVARLRPGVTLAEADTDVNRLLSIWLRAWPPPPGFDARIFDDARLAAALRPLRDDLVGDLDGVLWVLMGTMTLVLLIACANVANLLLIRAEARHQELAIRSALGAGWGGIAAELMTESLLLAIGGGALGLALAYAGVRGLVAAAPAGLPRLDAITIDPTVLGFTALVSIGSALVFGAIPIGRHAGRSPDLAVTSGARGASAGRERQRARDTLVVAQVALALILLIGAGLMIRSIQALRGVDPGFTDADVVQTVRLSIPENQLDDSERVYRLFEDIRSRIAAIPGVAAVAFTSSAPLQGFDSNDVLFAEDRVYAAAEIPPIRRFKFVSPGLFTATGTRLVAGRDFELADAYEYREVAIVSDRLARDLWGEPAAALGRRVRATAGDPWREVVGVVADVRDDGIAQPPPPTAYWPALMRDFWTNERFIQRSVTFLIRGDRTGEAGFVDAIRMAVWAADGAVPVAQVGTLQDLHDRSLARTAFTLVMLSIAAAMALALGGVGLYGVVAYAVTQRRREIGIRAALGASGRDLERMFLARGLVLAGVGVLCGLAGAALLAGWLSSMIYGIDPIDPLTYAGVAVTLVAIAALASYLPARRAAAVDPTEILRVDG